MMVLLRSFVPSLAMMLLAAGQAGAQGVLIDKSEIRFACKQMGVNVEGRFRKWKANIVFSPKDLAKSKAEFDIDLASIDLASDECVSKGITSFEDAGSPFSTVDAFKSMAAEKSTGIGAVAGGISEALVTTAVGLFVAIPAVWMFNFFTSKIEAFDVEMGNSSSELIDYFLKRSQQVAK